MKAFRWGGFSTRKFADWLQAFNVLCALAATAILGFGAYHLLARTGARALDGVVLVSGSPGSGDRPRVDADTLETRLELAEGGARLGEAVRRVDEATGLAVLDEAAASCRAGAVALEAVVASDEHALGARARAELEAALDQESGTPLETLRARALDAGKRPAHDLELDLAARAVLGPNAYRRSRAVRRVAALHDGRGIPLLLLALGVPPSEEPARAIAERALESFAPELGPPGNGSAEERWTEWWARARAAFLAPPYDLAKLAGRLARALVSPVEQQRADALRGLGLLRDERARACALELLSSARDPLARATAAWVLGRLGGADATRALAAAAESDSLAFVRAAALRSIGEARLEAARPVAARALDERDETLRLAAALALVRLGDRSALAVVDLIAFDERRTPAERRDALLDLEATGDLPAASSRWVAALSDPDDTVRSAARAALERRVPRGVALVGRPAWERWWRDRFGTSGLTVPLGLGG
jgi:HEAT repeat protein